MKKIILVSLLSVGSVFAVGNNVYDAQCASCHGAKGNEKIAENPVIVGLSESKVIEKLKEYKSGKQKGDTMNGIAAGLSDEDILSVSKYISTFK